MTTDMDTKADWIATHDDEGHGRNWFSGDESWTAECWVCHPELDPTIETTTAGHRNTATKSVHRSHINCAHPRTPKGRAACRKANR